MEISQRKEQFSRAYVLAVAAAAGYAWYQPSVDDDSIDLGLAGLCTFIRPCTFNRGAAQKKMGLTAGR